MPTNVYTSVSISSYNAGPPPDDGSQTTANKIEWAKHKTKLADPIKTLSESINSNTLAAFAALVMTNDAGEANVIMHMNSFGRRFT